MSPNSACLQGLWTSDLGPHPRLASLRFLECPILTPPVLVVGGHQRSLPRNRSLPRLRPQLSESTVSHETFLLLSSPLSWFWLQLCTLHLWQCERTLASSKSFTLETTRESLIDSGKPPARPPIYTWASSRSQCGRLPGASHPHPFPAEAPVPIGLCSSGPGPTKPGAAVGVGAWGRAGVPSLRLTRLCALCLRESVDPPRHQVGRAGRAAHTHAANSASRARSSPAASRAPRARPCGRASFPRRSRRDAQSPRRCLARPGRAAPAPPPERGVGETCFFPSPPSLVLARPTPLLGCH